MSYQLNDYQKQILAYVNNSKDEVFPVSDGNCVGYDDEIKDMKTPLVAWQTKATNDLEQILKWSLKWPTCMWGRAEGKYEVTIDVDKHANDGIAVLNDIFAEHPEVATLFASTQTVQTPSGGFHYKFINPEKYKISQGQAIWPGIDIREQGKGFLVIPPTPGYVWFNEVERQPITKEFYNLYQKQMKSKHNTSCDIKPTEQTGFQMTDKWFPGEKHIKFVSLAGYLRRGGMDYEQILMNLEYANEHFIEDAHKVQKTHLEKRAKDICKRYPKGTSAI